MLRGKDAEIVRSALEWARLHVQFNAGDILLSQIDQALKGGMNESVASTIYATMVCNFTIAETYLEADPPGTASSSDYIAGLVSIMENRVDCDEMGRKNPLDNVRSVCEAYNMLVTTSWANNMFARYRDFPESEEEVREYRNKRDRFNRWRKRLLAEAKVESDFFEAAAIDIQELQKKLITAKMPRSASHRDISLTAKKMLESILIEECGTGKKRSEILSGIIDCQAAI